MVAERAAAVIFVDANIPIYSGGRPHPLREPSRQILRLVGAHPEGFITDAEVLQEMLHRYLALRAGHQGLEQVRDFARLLRGRVRALTAEDVERATELSTMYGHLQARDLAHLAVMQRLGVKRIVSADRGFDGLAGVERLDPARLGEWRDTVGQEA